jgi:hypothetical protein
VKEYVDPAFTEVAGVPDICGAELEGGEGVPGSVVPEGGEPDPFADGDGSGAAALDPEPPQPASAAIASATANVRSGGWE